MSSFKKAGGQTGLSESQEDNRFAIHYDSGGMERLEPLQSLKLQVNLKRFLGCLAELPP